jgi:hypothetical protein
LVYYKCIQLIGALCLGVHHMRIHCKGPGFKVFGTVLLDVGTIPWTGDRHLPRSPAVWFEPARSVVGSRLLFLMYWIFPFPRLALARNAQYTHLLRMHPPPLRQCMAHWLRQLSPRFLLVRSGLTAAAARGLELLSPVVGHFVNGVVGFSKMCLPTLQLRECLRFVPNLWMATRVWMFAVTKVSSALMQ